MKKRKQPRPIIGFLIDYLVDEYQKKIWAGCVDAAKDNDCSFISINGGSVRDTLQRTVRNEVYSLIDKRNVDGIIMMAGNIGNNLNDEELYFFASKFKNIKLITIARAIKDFPCVISDNETGTREAMEHLIKGHGFTRIGYVAGPKYSEEANIRLSTYQKVLEECGIPFNQDMVYRASSFDRLEGPRAVEFFLDQKRLDFQAIFCANDYIALYTVKELRKRKIRVPEDIAVVGFDDINDCVTSVPALSSVHQPMYEIGYKAVKIVLSLLRGESVPSRIKLPTHYVARESCGCSMFDYTSLKMKKNSVIEKNKKNERFLVENEIKRLFPTLTGSLEPPGWIGKFYTTVKNYIKTGRGNAFEIFKAKVKEFGNKDEAFDFWYNLLVMVFKLMRNKFNPSGRKKIVDDLYEQMLIFLIKTFEHFYKTFLLENIENTMLVRRTSEWLIHILDEETLKNNIRDHLPHLGIGSFFLFKYETGLEKELLAKVFCYYDHDNLVIYKEKDKLFRAKELIPGSLRRIKKPFSLFLIPVFFKSIGIGYTIFSSGIVDASFYEFMVNLISLTMENTKLINEVKDYASNLEKRVEERTEELREAQQKMMELANRAGRADIAIGIMHNVGNILNSVGVSIEQMKKIIAESKVEGLLKANQMLVEHRESIDEFLKSDPKGQMLIEYYLKLGELLSKEVEKNRLELQTLSEKVELIHNIVHDLKDYSSRDYSIALKEEVQINNLMDMALLMEESRLKKNHVEVHKEYSLEKPVVIEKTKLVHILVNLIKNAVEAMQGNKTDNRHITVTTGINKKNKPFIKISDNGSGIKPDDLKSIFMYGFSTKQDGHGFGLHSSANYMKEMGGVLKVESEGPGKGASFILELPPWTK